MAPTFAKTLFKGMPFCIVGDEKFTLRWKFLLEQMGATINPDRKTCSDTTLVLAAPGAKLPTAYRKNIVSLEVIFSFFLSFFLSFRIFIHTFSLCPFFSFVFFSFVLFSDFRVHILP